MWEEDPSDSFFWEANTLLIHQSNGHLGAPHRPPQLPCSQPRLLGTC